MISLNMIVKNEAHCIARCLGSVLPYISEAVIVDTGSTDDTVEVISRCLEFTVPHLTIYHRPWVNFGHNRTEALQLLKESTAFRSTYALLIDADEEFKPDPGFKMPTQKHDAYYAWHRVPSGIYMRPFLLWMGRDWTYKGVVHECIQEQHWYERLQGCEVIDHFDSHRNKSQTQRQKYLKDAELLAAEFPCSHDAARTAFYAAESYRWAKDYRNAVHWYVVRMDMGSRSDTDRGSQEHWWAAYMLAVVLRDMDQPCSLVIRAFQRAYQIRPSRAETLISMARYLYQCGKKEEAKAAYRLANSLPLTKDTLNVDPQCYWEVRSGGSHHPRSDALDPPGGCA